MDQRSKSVESNGHREMEYKYLTSEHKLRILQERVMRYEQEHYNSAINLLLLQQNGSAGTDVQGIRESMALLEKAIKDTEEIIMTLDVTADPVN